MSEEQKQPRKGKNRAKYAAKVRKQIPYHLGRDTSTLSNNQLKKLGQTYGINRSENQKEEI